VQTATKALIKDISTAGFSISDFPQWLFMAALWNRAGHYIVALWLLLLSFFLSFYLFSLD